MLRGRSSCAAHVGAAGLRLPAGVSRAAFGLRLLALTSACLPTGVGHAARGHGCFCWGSCGVVWCVFVGLIAGRLGLRSQWLGVYRRAVG